MNVNDILDIIQAHAKWADDEIIARYRDAFDANPDVRHMAFARWIRDDMQATIDTLRQQLEQLTAELAAVEAERDAVIDKLDRLEATIDQLPGVKDEIYKLLEEWNDEEKDRWLYGSEGL